MKFVLFRHGHSLANQESRIVSSLENGTRTDGGPDGTGFGLSPKGRIEVAERAMSLAEHIIASKPTGQQHQHQQQHALRRVRVMIVTSPFQRTLHTAAIIESQLHTAFSQYHRQNNNSTAQFEQENGLIVMPALRERFFGEFEMQTPSEDLYNRVWAADANNWFHELFGVESVADVTRRVTGVIRDLEQGAGYVAEGEEEEEVWAILVSHGDSLQILQTAMRGWSGDRHRQLEHLDTANWRIVEWCPELRAAHQVVPRSSGCW
ncbi:hypothetical protein BGW39_010157 [Mortierella sp. 14UC]|nr:hypothetical protein BGW39_010157 [Mortierella sp. 14UC]